MLELDDHRYEWFDGCQTVVSRDPPVVLWTSSAPERMMKAP